MHAMQYFYTCLYFSLAGKLYTDLTRNHNMPKCIGIPIH